MQSKPLLLKAIGIENFKSHEHYTYVPLRNISFFIGGNGTGKSAVWQVLRIFTNCFEHLKSGVGDDKPSTIAKSYLDLADFEEYGTDPTSLLYNRGKPLIIDLYSSIVFANHILKERIVIFRFTMTANEDLKYFLLDKFELLAEDKEPLFSYQYDFEEENFISTPIWEDYCGQYLLNILYDFKQGKAEKVSKRLMEYFKSSEENDFKELNNLPDAFFDLGNHGNIKFILSGKSTPNDAASLVFDPYLYIISANESFDSWEKLFELQNTFQEKNPMLAKWLTKTYGAIEDTFAELFGQIKEVQFVDRTLIAVPTRQVEFEKNGILKKFLDAYHDMGPESQGILADFAKHFQFKDLPKFIIDRENGKIKILQGSQYLRNTGTGYWCLTYIIYSIIYVLKNRIRIIIFEEPESHLHPSFHAILMDFFIKVANEWNITIILETHSEYMTRRAQLRVYENHHPGEDNDPVSGISRMLKFNNPQNISLNAKNVLINSFELRRDGAQSESSHVQTIYIQEDGLLTNEYPRSFAGVANDDALLLFQLRNNNN